MPEEASKDDADHDQESFQPWLADPLPGKHALTGSGADCSSRTRFSSVGMLRSDRHGDGRLVLETRQPGYEPQALSQRLGGGVLLNEF